MWQLIKLGKIEYLKALEYQLNLVNLKQKSLKDEFLILLEHPDTYTMGKGADKNNILDKNIPIIVTNRGGDITYHGQGQMICYIIMNLKSKNLDLHEYLRKIESVIIKTLKKLNINAYRIQGLSGVWAENKKLASIGIGVKKGITMHGFSLNINTDLKKFYKINPCGLKPEMISSVKELKKKHISFKHIESLLLESFTEVFSEGIYMIYDEIEKATKEQKIVFFDYYSEAKGFCQKSGEPYKIEYTGSSHKLYLFDYDRNEVRPFIIDNISNLTISDETFVPHNQSKTIQI